MFPEFYELYLRYGKNINIREYEILKEMQINNSPYFDA